MALESNPQSPQMTINLQASMRRSTTLEDLLSPCGLWFLMSAVLKTYLEWIACFCCSLLED